MQADFNAILSELGTSIGLALEIDANGACLLKMESECQIQLEWNSETMSLQLFSKLGSLTDHLPTRKALLMSALKANRPDVGLPMILCYSDVHRQLMLYQSVNPTMIEVPQLLELIAAFEQQALIWIEALRVGRPPMAFQSNRQDPNIFQAVQWQH